MKNQEKTLTGDQILADATALAPTIVERRDEIERNDGCQCIWSMR
jgi:hypothetical protein